MSLNGKTAVVTGAALGIGKAMAEILVKNGAKVVLLDVNEAAGKQFKEVLDKQYGKERTVFLKCDVQSDEQIKAALQKTIETFGGIDILCNNAGILNENEWEKTVSINLLGLVRVTYQAMSHMNKLTGGRGGVIVNTASLAGLGPFLSCPVYTASKHGVIGFTRAIAAASTASGYGIRFNAICPCFVQTELFSNICERLGPYSHLAEVTKSLYDVVGLISPSPVAECLLELVTDETKNGDIVTVTTKGREYKIFPPIQGLTPDTKP
ncbi:uncharacterized protein V6R79_026315 [Siganus canaliculatus]